MGLIGLIRDWRYEPDKTSAREITDANGKPKILVRIELGVLVLEAEGRPDGKRPYGHESLLDYLQHEYAIAARTGEEFCVLNNHYKAYIDEFNQYTTRMQANFALGKYDHAMLDAQRQLRALDFMVQFTSAENCPEWERHRAYFIFIATMAETQRELYKRDYQAALESTRRGYLRLRSYLEDALPYVDGSQFLEHLQTILDETLKCVPDPLKSLRDQLQRAIGREDYERAAQIRDRIADINTNKETS